MASGSAASRPASLATARALLPRPGAWMGGSSVLTRVPRFVGIRATRDSLLAYLPIPQWDAIVRSDPEAWRWFAALTLRNCLLAVSIADALCLGSYLAQTDGVMLLTNGITLGATTEALIKQQGALVDAVVIGGGSGVVRHELSARVTALLP